MKSFKEFLAEKTLTEKVLTEKLHNIDPRDIDLIYAPLRPHIHKFADAFKRYPSNSVADTHNIADFLEKQQRSLENMTEDEVDLKTFSSSELVSPDAVLAHSIKPIEIRVSIIGSNSYAAIVNSIEIGIELDIIALFGDYYEMPDSEKAIIRREFTDQSFRSTIAHELSHWLDDALHDQHITKQSRRNIKKRRDPPPNANRQQLDKYNKRKEYDPYLPYVKPDEIQAMVSQVAYMKRDIGEEAYNKLSFEELCDLIPGFPALLGSQYSHQWKRLMLTRMSREGLVGPKMR